MLIEKLCTPAVLYIGFSLIYIIIDIFSKEYVEAGIKFIIMITMTATLNFLCDNDLKVTAYIIVFLPLMFMFYLSGLLIYIFGIPTYSWDYSLNKKSNSDSDLVSSDSDSTSNGFFSSILPDFLSFNTDDSKCGEYCLPENTCVENCYINGCYKKTDNPNSCWKQYSKDLEGRYEIYDLNLSNLTKSGTCKNHLTEQDCKQYALDNQFEYKGTFAYGSRYPEKCFIKDAYKGETALYYNIGSGKECSKLQPCVCDNTDNNEDDEDIQKDSEDYYKGEGCEPGTYCNAPDGFPTYGNCSTPYYCEPCSDNTYCNEGNCDTCISCPEGQTSQPGSILCS